MIWGEFASCPLVAKHPAEILTINPSKPNNTQRPQPRQDFLRNSSPTFFIALLNIQNDNHYLKAELVAKSKNLTKILDYLGPT
jgi:hypothetical protein